MPEESEVIGLCRFLVVVLLLFGVVLPAGAQRPVQIESSGRGDSRTPIAIPPFATGSGAENYGASLASVLSRDLEFTGQFSIVSRSDY